MPRLSRVRFHAVGHPNARLEDLVLDLRGADGHATDSTIWLRNGGGKSSILNLFFATLRTRKRDFLGGRADSRRRALEDYLQPGEPGAVITEWELDDPAGTLDVGEKRRFLAGAFYEHRTGANESLRRLFFSTISTPGIPETTLEGLPLTRVDDGVERKVTLAQFRQRWLALREAAPGLTPVATEVQHEWQEVLDNAGLDPDLFRYQLQMNLREGGADEIFRFDDDEAFIDFLLELTIDPDRADDIGRTLSTFREQLRRRQLEFIPDRKLASGLLERFEPLARVADDRRRGQERLHAASARLDALERAIVADAHRAREQARELVARRDHHFARESELRMEASRLRREAVAWDHDAARRLEEAARTLLETARIAETDARRRDVLLRAAVPLREARLREAEATSWREEHAQRSEALAPDLARVEASARHLVAALRARARNLGERRGELEARIRSLEAAAESRATEARRLSQEVGERSSALRRLEQMQQRDAALRAQWESEGVLEGAESIDDAARRWRERAERAMTQVEHLEESERVRINRLDSLREEIGAADAELRDLAARQREASVELAASRTAFAKLADDPRLLRLLELEQAPDWDTISPRHATLLRRTASSLRQRAATLRAEHFAHARALVHLEESGVLPPDADVERALAVLEGHALSGWTWLARNIASTSERQKLALRHPALARGLVVIEGKVEQAVRTLEENGFVPVAPLALALPAAFQSAEVADVLVMGQGTEAYHDPDVARRRLERMREQQEEREREANRLEREAEELLALGIAFASLRERYPVGHAAQLQRAIEQLVEEQDRVQARRRRAEQDLVDAREAASETTASQRRLRSEALEAERLALRLEQSVRERETDRGEGDARLLLEREIAERRALLDEIEVQSDKERISLGELRSQVRALAEEIRLVESDASRIPHVRAEDVEPAAGDVDALRIAWEREVRLYEQKAGDDQALEMAARYDAMGQDARRTMRRILIESTSEDDVAALLAEMPDADMLERRREEAGHRLSIAQARVFEAEHQVTVASKRRHAASEAWKAERRPEVPHEVETGREAERRALECRATADARVADAEQESAESQRLALLAERTLHGADSRSKDASRTSALRRAFGDLVASALSTADEETGSTAAPDAPDVSLETLDEDLARIEAVLREAQGRAAELDKDRRRAAEALRRWCDHDDFATLRSEVSGRVRALSDLALEEEASRFMEQLSLRVAQLDAAIADGERHHAQVCRLVLDMAESGLRQVRLAASSSRVPDRVPDIGGQHFLRITTSEPSDPATRLALVSSLVDELVAEEDIPTGPELVRRAVRRIARPFRVRVLNPDTSAQRRSIPIAETSKFSGGEQLTCAILLYCTLAGVRARNRGRARQPSSVLMLDNPVGRASRRRFLEMQREFARAMGVQLVYTTAVNDHEALSVLPNVIRLRNERVDRTRGHRLVEFDEDEATRYGRVEGARIARVERRPDEPPAA